MSEAKEYTIEDFKKAMDEKINSFVKETFHSESAQGWMRMVLRAAIKADITDSVNDFATKALETDAFMKEWEFRFSGEETECGLARRGIPHAPHVAAHYSTPAWEGLQHYCLGKEGAISLWNETITITMVSLERYKGGAHGKVRVEVKA